MKGGGNQTKGRHATYIESTKQGDDHTSKVYSCSINPNRVKHHCHLPLGAYEKCCAAIQKTQLSIRSTQNRNIE
jgi:hypothetical protein